MDTPTFLGLEPTEQPDHWRLPITPHICSGIGALFGGCGLGAAIAALEAQSGRDVVWVTVQYLNFASPPSILELRVDEEVRGRQMSQSILKATNGDTTVLTAIAALGTRKAPWSGDFTSMPEVPAPEECPTRKPMARWQTTFQSVMDARIADARELDALDGTPGTGRAALWIRVPDLDLSPATLAILADCVPWGVGQALGLRVGGNSLDNTLRIVHRPTPADRDGWVLVDVSIDAIADGFAHGRVQLWARDGRLFASAAQSVVVREWNRPPAPHRISGFTGEDRQAGRNRA